MTYMLAPLGWDDVTDNLLSEKESLSSNIDTKLFGIWNFCYSQTPRILLSVLHHKKSQFIH
jgi:hypothetical protein